MAYSLDPDENKGNAYSPSEHMTMNEQLLYKLAALDASMNSGFRRIDEKIDRFQKDLHESQIEINDKINRLDTDTKTNFAYKRTRIDALEKRVISLETWSAVLMGKVAIAVTIVLLLWTFIAPTIRNVVGIDNG